MSQERAREIIRKWLNMPTEKCKTTLAYDGFPVSEIQFTARDFQQLESLIAEALEQAVKVH